MRELLQIAFYGAGSYFQSNHTVVLVLGILLYFSVAGKTLKPREKRLLAVTAVLLLLVLFPGSAAGLMLYQTRFYSYHWIWSLVPTTLCIAWGGTRLLWELTGQQRRDGKAARRLAAGMAVLLAFLLLTGNMGNLRSADREQESARQAAVYLEQLPQAGEALLWAPRPVLEAVRRHSGEIRLLYGRNMWEPEAAAYAYDTYPMEQQRLFDWMETIEKGDAYEMPLGLRIYLEDVAAVWEDGREQGSQVLADAYMLQLAARQGSRLWVFPDQATERVALACGQMWEEYGLRAKMLGEMAGYTVWNCEECL